jgi:23S rRNA pseudouridine1911/1915/1917 synthase
MPEFDVDAAGAGQRLDVWLEHRLPDCSRARVQSLIKTGCVTVDGARVKAHHKGRPGERVEVVLPAPAPALPAPQAIPLDVLFEDRHIIVVNKPPGLVVHPAVGHPDGTLVNALLHHCRDLAGVGGERRPGIVHRLDRDTSGALVAAKHDAAMQALVRQFRSGDVHKEYLAVVHGVPRPAAGTVETLIGRSRHDRKKMSAQPARGRRAVTHYRVTHVAGDFALLHLRIETGRTHQIRVHLAHVGYPIVGDATYGRRRDLPTAVRQMLHAWRLSFRHPATEEPATFTAPLPPDLLTVLAVLGLDPPE